MQNSQSDTLLIQQKQKVDAVKLVWNVMSGKLKNVKKAVQKGLLLI